MGIHGIININKYVDMDTGRMYYDGRGERNMKDSRKKKELFEDRVRFNWGYHDAWGDARSDRVRQLSSFGPQSIRVVSGEYDRAYYDGYQAGIREFHAGVVYTESSEQAWKRMTMSQAEYCHGCSMVGACNVLLPQGAPCSDKKYHVSERP